jgi:hypothetical protein
MDVVHRPGSRLTRSGSISQIQEVSF